MTSPFDRLNSALAGRYRIERELGAGGMATVYLAHDEKHDRKVAIKVLKPELAAVLGAERFVVEIKTTASLSHPHILPLFDSGTADGFLFYVMPYIEGETIREKLNRETQLGVDEAVRIAREVADALDYAHRHGVIHRDIKPENILLHDGRAMVMDFGIALAVSAAAGGRMTETGLSLGTPHYMSPEQATAEKEITARSDEYSLASVLYEMLAGQPPHIGGPAQQVIMRIITEPSRPVSEFRKNVPLNVVASLAKALEKLPADRFESAKAFADALGNPAYRSAEGAVDSDTPVSRRSRALGLAGWVAAAAMALVATWQWARRAEVEPEQPVIRAIVSSNLRTDALGPTVVAISNDGSQIVYRRPDSTGTVVMFVRSLATNVDVRFGGVAYGGPFFSPDGGTIGYFTGNELRLHPLTGGDRTLIASGTGSTGVWGTDGFITIATQRALIRVAASGSKPDTLTTFDADHRLTSPSLSRDARTLFLTLSARGQGPEATVVAFPLDTRKVVPLGITGSRPVLVADRWLTYATTDGSLHAVSFDLRTLKPGTDSRVISQDVALSPTSVPRVAVAPLNGTAVYVTGGSERDKELALLDRSGRGGPVVAETRAFRAPRFSPDGQRIAVGVTLTSFASGDIWMATIANHGFVRATSDSVSFYPNWEADGRHLLLIKRTERRAVVFRMPTDGTSPATKLIERPSMVYEAVPLPDGRGIVFREDANNSNRDVYLQPSDSGAAPMPLAATAFDEKGVAVSPDSKWLAYASNESGVNEVYIRRIEPGSPRWPVSHGGGTEPRWARNGELFFRHADSVFVTRVAPGAEPKIAPPSHLFTAQFDATGYEPVWDVSPDGSRFAVTRTKEGAAATQLIVLVNALRAPKEK